MTYQDRKDIDALYNLIWDNEKERLNFATISQLEELLSQIRKIYDKSEVEEIATELDNSLNSLDTSLTNLLANLNAFNEALFVLDEDNVGLETDLTELAENLGILTGMLDEFDGELTAFQESLDGFDVELNGDATHDGFVDTLQAIQTAIGSDVNPSPTSLKGMLNAFGEQLQQVAQGDNALALSLSALSGYLTKFQGTLAEFKAQIESDLGQSVYDGLDQQVINLIYSIASTQQDISDHQDSLDGLNDTIGDSSDVLADGTLYGVLNNTSGVASSAQTKANQVSNTITNTITPQINGLDTTATNIKNKMGYNNIPNNTTLQGQITTQGNTIGSPSDSASANTLFGKVTNAQNTANAVDSRVGTPSDPNVTTTVFSSLEETINDVSIVQTAIGNVEDISTNLVNDLNNSIGDIENVQNVMYKGTGGNHSDSATPSNPATGSFCKAIKTDVGTAQTTANTANSTANSALTTANSVDTKVGTVDVQNDGDLATQVSTAQSTANTASSTANSAQTKANSVDAKVGTVNVSTDGTLAQQSSANATAIENVDEKVGDVDVDVNSDLQTQITSIVSFFNDLVPIVPNVTNIDDVSNGTSSRGNKLAVGNFPYNFIYLVSNSKYYQRQDLDTSGTLGYYGEWVQIPSITSVFNQTDLYTMISNYFTTSGHTHTKSNITDFAHTHTKSQISDFSHTHSQSDVRGLSTALAGKQDAIPSFTQQGSFTAYGVTVTYYSDGLYVYVHFSGSLAHTSSMPRVTSGTNVISSDYCPKFSVKSPMGASSNGFQLEVQSGGTIRYWGSTSQDTAVGTTVMYPLNSRMP